MYENTLCPGCGQPKEIAWHAESDGEYVGHEFVCFGCKAQSGESSATYHALVRIPDAQALARYSPFDLIESTAAPSQPNPKE